MHCRMQNVLHEHSPGNVGDGGRFISCEAPDFLLLVLALAADAARVVADGTIGFAVGDESSAALGVADRTGGVGEAVEAAAV